MIYEFIKTHKNEFSIEKMAKVLGVSRSGYYEFMKRGKSSRALENERLKKKIKQIHTSSRGTYGSPRVHATMKNNGETCSRKRVAKLMRQEGLQAKMRKKWKRTINRSSQANFSKNLLNQNFEASAPNEKWVSDITYVSTREGWLYLAVVMDLFSRKIVGIGMSNTLHTDLVAKALKQALKHRNVSKGTIHHSDKGCQYTSKEFAKLASDSGIILSMSGKGNCYDNAVAESFFHTLKTEHTKFCDYKIREEARSSIFEYIEVFYNRMRLHSTIGYMSPEEFEKKMPKKAKL